MHPSDAVHPSESHAIAQNRNAVVSSVGVDVVLDEVVTSVDRVRRSVAQVGVLLVVALVAMVVVVVAQVQSGAVVVGV